MSSMKVVDENLDGINEPGEYLIVEEIKVSNNGEWFITYNLWRLICSIQVSCHLPRGA